VSLDFDDLISEFRTRNAQREPPQRSLTPSVHTCQNQNNLDPPSLSRTRKKPVFIYFVSRTHGNFKNKSVNA
jgi:hypothetical protein